jgi:hypothetical protein
LTSPLFLLKISNNVSTHSDLPIATK